MTKVEVNPAVPVEEWRAFLDGRPEATYAHLPGWQAVLRDSLGHQPYYIFARNEAGKLCGVLPLFQVKSVLSGSHLVSTPFVSECGPAAESDEALKAMVDRARSLCDELKCRYMEIRVSRELPQIGLPVNQYFFTYFVPLSDPQKMWKALDHRTRNSVNKSRKDGVVVKTDGSEMAMKAFYEVNLRTKTRLGSPAHPLKFFQAMQRELGDCFRLYSAEYEGRVVSAGVAIRCNGVVNATHQASDRNYLEHHPNDAVSWQEMEDGGRDGFRYLDFGKTPADNTGLAQYKKKWKAEEKKLYYYYYPSVPKLMGSNRQGTKFKIVTGVWKRLPLPIARSLGPLAFRQLD
jgi:serine/alanine adding enzyme